MRTLIQSIGLLAFLTSVLAVAQTPSKDAGVPVNKEAAAAPADTKPPPSGDEVRRVLDYYYNGKDRGPALVDLKPCLKVDSVGKDNNSKNECAEFVTGPVKKDTTVHGWSYWYLPEGANYDDVVMQFLHNNDVRTTVDLKLNQPGRNRTWRSTTASKKGKWTIRIKRGDQELGSTSFTVE